MTKYKGKISRTDLARILISNTLQEMGIGPHLSGFDYMKAELLILTTEQDRKHKSMTLYKRVADEYDVSVCSVERAIRYAIEYAFLRNYDQSLDSMFSKNDHVPSNYEFICAIAEKLQNELCFGMYQAEK